MNDCQIDSCDHYLVCLNSEAVSANVGLSVAAVVVVAVVVVVATERETENETENAETEVRMENDSPNIIANRTFIKYVAIFVMVKLYHGSRYLVCIQKRGQCMKRKYSY